MKSLKAIWRSLGGATRRGVVSILAMMFLVLFGSLALAMAVVSKGNLRTASTQLHVNKALSAAETGLTFARARIEEATSRFLVTKGTIDRDFGIRLWDGTTSSGDGTISVLPPPSGFTEAGLPAGIAQALQNAHAADQNIVAYTGSITSAVMGSAPSGTDPSVVRSSNWVFTPAIGIDGSSTVAGATPAAFQITYAPMADGVGIRVIVTGYSSVGVTGSSYSYGSSDDIGRPLTRTIQQDFRISKQLRQAIISPTRILIGKGVQITGNLGSRYDRTTYDNGEPVLMRSDFKGLNATLDSKLNALLTALRTSDTDGDNRLRVGHATEGAAIPSNATDYNSDGQPDNAFADATGDGYVDEFDVFMNHYDANRDGKVALSNVLRAGTANSGLTAEFTSDDDLAIQIDSAVPDRNKNGFSGFADSNGNGRWDNGEAITDRDLVNNTFPDQVLGWRDGVLDRRDKYAKVRGRMSFKVSQSQWTTDRGDIRDDIQGAIVPPRDQSALRFGASDTEIPAVAASNFDSARSGLIGRADGLTFAQQVAAQINIAPGLLGTYTEANTNSAAPRYWRSNLDNTYVRSRTGRDLFEKMPFNSTTFYDYYVRPRYENMVFTNVKVPKGNNGLFINCTFVGVTHVETYQDNTHQNWSSYGKLLWNASTGVPTPDPQPLDRSDFLRYTSGLVQDGPSNYDQFPNPPVINGTTQVGGNRDTKKYSNNVRFHDCLVVGSIVSDTPSVYTHVRNKLQFTGSTRFTDKHPTAPDDPALNPRSADVAEIQKSSLMAPQYSVDIGTFNSPTDAYNGSGAPTPQNVNLQGTVIAGILDARGNTTIDGSLVLTFDPVPGVAPLVSGGVAVGNPALFNASLGYFGAADGDGESIDPATLPVVSGQRVVGYDLDGDGISDTAPGYTPSAAEITAGARLIPFYGYGRVNINWNPRFPMPDGLLLPLSVVPVTGSYKEGKQ